MIVLCPQCQQSIETALYPSGAAIPCPTCGFSLLVSGTVSDDQVAIQSAIKMAIPIRPSDALPSSARDESTYDHERDLAASAEEYEAAKKVVATAAMGMQVCFFLVLLALSAEVFWLFTAQKPNENAIQPGRNLQINEAKVGMIVVVAAYVVTLIFTFFVFLGGRALGRLRNYHMVILGIIFGNQLAFGLISTAGILSLGIALSPDNPNRGPIVNVDATIRIALFALIGFVQFVAICAAMSALCDRNVSRQFFIQIFQRTSHPYRVL